MSKYFSPNGSLRFVNSQVCRICRFRSTPAGTKYALCNDYVMIMSELLTVARGQQRTYVELLIMACGSERVCYLWHYVHQFLHQHQCQIFFPLPLILLAIIFQRNVTNCKIFCLLFPYLSCK